MHKFKLKLKLPKILIIIGLIALCAVLTFWASWSGSHRETLSEKGEGSAAATTPESAIPTAMPISEPAPKKDSCMNAFFPVSEGYQVSYGNVVGRNAVPSFVSVFKDQKGDSIRQEYDFGSDQVELRLTCFGGRVVPEQYVDLTSTFGSHRLDVKTKSVEGELLPKELPKDKLWKLRYVVAVKTDDARLTKAGLKEVTYNIEETHKVVSDSESLQTPAGNHEVVRVQVDQVVTAQLPKDSQVKIDPVRRTFYAYYGKHAGLLRLVEIGKWDIVAIRTKMQ